MAPDSFHRASNRFTGLISRELFPYAKTIIGVDNSAQAVDRYNKGAKALGISHGAMHAIACELEDDPAELRGQQFDVITVSIQLSVMCVDKNPFVQCTVAYHHFASIEEKTKLLASYLKPGGSLIVVDLHRPDASGDGVPEYFNATVVQIGVTEKEMRDVFERAGLIDFKFQKGQKITAYGDFQPSTFLASAKKVV